MLILTRRTGETLCIGDDINVTVLAIRGNQVRIGVDAPKEVPVHREEIAERIRNENDGKLKTGEKGHGNGRTDNHKPHHVKTENTLSLRSHAS